jgi:carboxypeptidase C (cathepsin A)
MAKVGNEIKTYKKTASVRDYTPWLFKTEANAEKRLMELPPCTFGEPIIEYFNDPTVRSLLHIPSTVQAWDLCTNGITYNQLTTGSQWVYEKYQGKYKMLFYSGDTDGAVPTYGSLQWIAQLNWAVTDAWRAYMVDDQVGGYVEAYQGGLTFGSVHGAGHMAPQFKRAQTYHLIFNWLNDETI